MLENRQLVAENMKGVGEPEHRKRQWYKENEGDNNHPDKGAMLLAKSWAVVVGLGLRCVLVLVSIMFVLGM